MFATVAYPRVKELTESILASGLIYLNSHAVDFKTPELRARISTSTCAAPTAPTPSSASS